MPKVIALGRKYKRSALDSRGERKNAEAVATTSSRPLASVSPLSRNGNDAAAPVKADIAVSVVVPTRGRPQLLNRCLSSLVAQSMERHRYEIIVVDDGPSDDTKEIVASWKMHSSGDGPDIIYIPSPGPHGPAAARNHGWQAARGEIIAFTDDDTVATPDWLKNGLAAFGPDVHTVCGQIVMPFSGTPTDYERDAMNLETAEFVTANCFCRKRVLEDLGGFDERFRFAWREDSDLHFRLIDYSANIVRAPQAVVEHPIRPAPWGVSLTQLKKIQFDALLYKKHPFLYRRRIRAKPRWDYYLTVAALLAAIFCYAGDQPELAFLSGAIWLFMTARFCLSRLRHTAKTAGHIAEMVVTSALIPPVAVFWRAVGALKFRVGFL
nr:glycosyltransferase [Noviherbaspirillum massiliense]